MSDIDSHTETRRWRRGKRPNKHRDPLLKDLAKAFKDTQPNAWLTGTVAVPPEDLTLFFKAAGSDSEASVLNSSFDDVKAIEALVLACERATFGRNDQDVLDETYRKAGKLDHGRFAWGFNPSILERQIRDALVPFEGSKNRLRFDRYKLNVYGKGSFFKPHKDTPRGEDMVGSLVLILPTNHEGGALVLRHSDKEFTFDAASSLKFSVASSLAYAAFYSDVEHEVLPVTSGHRITITYNIFSIKNYDEPFAEKEIAIQAREKRPGGWSEWVLEGRYKEPPSPPPSKRHDLLGTPFSSPFGDMLSKLLDNPQFLPDGGLLGFALQHLYPVPRIPELSTRVDWEDFVHRLKGRDAILAHTCAELGLKHSLRTVYNSEDRNGEENHWVATSKGIYGLDHMDTDPLKELLRMQEVPSLTWSSGKDSWGETEKEVTMPVLWITPPFSLTAAREPMIAYGNEPSLGYTYANFALIVRIGEFGNRTGPQLIEEVRLSDKPSTGMEQDLEEEYGYESYE